ncbi:sensor histidine kinase [Thermoanaerobacterium sp. RBIITD]|uniref:sensor histidine kinase n=1 Tax=Thermoanaerobacterium sp. RBIITD TaxID=1550240 RepID=UPI000BB8DE78|nr:sensor histidine kinase [Thermoanaerobacterium sp. RBIITD]SNX53420.1 two-component system, sensor histidine kinase YesM [Thermoanaerobacterium sp. RBIITD]
MKKISQKFFYKNLLILSIPLLVIVIILGSLSIIITERYVSEEINKNSNETLKRNSEDVEFLLNEINQIYLTFGTNKDVTMYLKRILNTSEYSLEDTWRLNMIESLLNSTSFSKPYIQSIYLYFKNPNKNFLASSDGITSLDRFYDKKWFDSFLNSPDDKLSWVEVRDLKLYNFNEKGIRVLSIFKKVNDLYNGKSDGVLVLNIYLDYIERFLNASTIIPEQKVLILDENNRLICQNSSGNFPSIVDINKYKDNNIISELKSADYNIKYISIVPREYLYRVPIMLLKITLLLLALSILFVIFLTYNITKRNYTNIRKIIDIIDSAKSTNAFPPLPPEYKDDYSYITYNILTNYMEQNYLKLQLSEKKYKMQAMELLALQSQISPHFLFNTMETIYLKTLALTGGPNNVTKMIENLSQILKYLLSNPNETVTLKEEIDNTKSYIDILKVRYRDKFEVMWDYDESLLPCKVMKLMLQHLIENSIYHGLKEKEGRGVIKIRIKHKRDGEIKIAVVDNGLGISKEKLSQIREQLKSDFDFQEHIGLMNTKERLKLLYDDKYNIIIRSKFGMGTAVYITFPYKSKEVSHDNKSI